MKRPRCNSVGIVTTRGMNTPSSAQAVTARRWKNSSSSCYVIGWFMPYYFAGRLESGNVCEYFIMMRYFNEIGITAHDDVLHEMAMKEKEHEVYFQKSLQNNRLLPLFEKIFGSGNKSSFNDVNLENKSPVEESKRYCKHRK